MRLRLVACGSLHNAGVNVPSAPGAQGEATRTGTHPSDEVHARHGEERQEREKELHELELHKPGACGEYDSARAQHWWHG